VNVSAEVMMVPFLIKVFIDASWCLFKERNIITVPAFVL